MKVKIKRLTNYAGPDKSVSAGKADMVDYREGKRLVDAGKAEWIGKPPEEQKKEPAKEPEWPKATGGGWYQPSNGEKIQGREEAFEAQETLGKGEGEGNAKTNQSPSNGTDDTGGSEGTSES